MPDEARHGLHDARTPGMPPLTSRGGGGIARGCTAVCAWPTPFAVVCLGKGLKNNARWQRGQDMGQSRKADDKFDLERVALAMPRLIWMDRSGIIRLSYQAAWSRSTKRGKQQHSQSGTCSLCHSTRRRRVTRPHGDCLKTMVDQAWR